MNFILKLFITKFIDLVFDAMQELAHERFSNFTVDDASKFKGEEANLKQRMKRNLGTKKPR